MDWLTVALPRNYKTPTAILKFWPAPRPSWKYRTKMQWIGQWWKTSLGLNCWKQPPFPLKAYPVLTMSPRHPALALALALAHVQAHGVGLGEEALMPQQALHILTHTQPSAVGLLGANNKWGNVSAFYYRLDYGIFCLLKKKHQQSNSKQSLEVFSGCVTLFFWKSCKVLECKRIEYRLGNAKVIFVNFEFRFPFPFSLWILIGLCIF